MTNHHSPEPGPDAGRTIANYTRSMRSTNIQLVALLSACCSDDWSGGFLRNALKLLAWKLL